MAAEVLEVQIKSYLDSAGFKQLEAHAKKFQKTQVEQNAAALKLSNTMNTTFQQASQYVKQAANETKRFKMEWLGVMFAGMAMQRMFNGLLRGAFATWSAVTEGTNKAGGAMTQLQAAWEFFKFSLFEALLGSSLFQTMVDWVLKLVEYWGNLDEKTRSLYASLVLVGLIFGTILFVVGQLAMGLHSISMLLVGQNLSIAAIKKGFIAMSTTINTTLLPAMAKAWALAAPFALIAAILMAIGYIVWMAKELGGFGEFFKAVARGVIMLSAVMAAGFVKFVGGGIDYVMGLVENFVKGLRVAASIVDALTGSRLAKRVDAYVSQIAALRKGLSGAFDAQANSITSQAAQFIVDRIPLQNEGADVSFNTYMQTMAQAVTAGIRGAAPELGAEIGRNTKVDATQKTAVIQSNSFEESMKRQGLPY